METVESTNAWAKAHAAAWPADQLTVVTAKTQTAGQGRRGRRWRSPPSGNLAVTFFFVTPSYHQLQHIGQVAALSVIETLSSLGLPIRLKLPNDLQIHRKKLAGILCETVPVSQRIGVLVGIGININTPASFLRTIDQPATSLLVELGTLQNVKALQEQLIAHFNRDLTRFEKEGFIPFEKNLGDALK